MRFRAVVIEDDSAIREVLQVTLEARGYEVHAFADPGACPAFERRACGCGEDIACCDVLITDLEMPVARGLDVVAQSVSQGCRCPHIAVMSGSWSEQDRNRALTLGCRTFTKPFSLYELGAWLDACESQIAPERALRDWPIVS